jgi:hypothetical protein
MPLNYSAYHHRRLCEVVIAGSHDAGIDSGGGLTRTQTVNIRQQLLCGARFFDLRIASRRVTVNGQQEAEFATFHAPRKPGGFLQTKKVNRPVVGQPAGGNQQVDAVHKGLLLGHYGQALVDVLQDVAAFLNGAPTEFVILKFDKTMNKAVVASLCQQHLGARMYTGVGAGLNETPIGQLAGQAIVTFQDNNQAGVGLGGGAVGICNLQKGLGYNPNYVGIQYYGKGGKTKWKLGVGRKIAKNRVCQERLMTEALNKDPRTLGMLYWTTTGFTESVKSRDDQLWADGGADLSKLWSECLLMSAYQLPPHVNLFNPASGVLLKLFFPNIIMMDFVNPPRCNTVFQMNATAGTTLTQMATLYFQNDPANQLFTQHWQ